MTKVAHTSTTSTDAPRVPLGPRPAFPAQAAPVKHLPHDLPTAPYRPAALTREQLDREIQAAKQHDPYLVGYGAIQANAAF